jgi:DNA mismatch repair protein MutL
VSTQKKIDINIHPTKTEIKFEEEQSIYAILRSAIKHSLGIFQVIPTLDFEQNKDLAIPYDFIEKTPLMPTIDIDSSFNPFKDKSSTYSKKNNHEREGLLSGFNLVDSREHIEQKNFNRCSSDYSYFSIIFKIYSMSIANEYFTN